MQYFRALTLLWVSQLGQYVQPGEVFAYDPEGENYPGQDGIATLESRGLIEPAAGPQSTSMEE